MDWIVLVTKLRATGMPIRRLQEYAALRRRGGGSGRRQIALLERHRDDVLARVHDLRENLVLIEQMIATCRNELST
jgi:DNA-binding transcriptional MerR regulator